MSAERPFDFSKVCRVCLTEGPSMPIFGGVGLHRKLMACANVQVWQNDGLPRQLCKKCAARLHAASQFKRQCEKSDTVLRRHRDSGNYFESDRSDDAAGTEVGDPARAARASPSTGPADCEFSACAIRSLSDEREYESVDIRSVENRHSPIYADGDVLSAVGYEVRTISPEGTMAVRKPEDASEGDEKRKNDDEGSFHCPICDKAFATPNGLNRHSRTHSDEILYRCDVCNKGFVHGGNFKVHMMIHNDERPFSCRFCDRKCRQRQDLNKHMRTHTGEKPHVCQMCRKAFSTSSNLAAHRRIHKGEKPYICTICQKGFCQSNELTKHVRGHTGEKSHICPICKKGFNGSSTMTVHMRKHTGERPYACGTCHKGFTQSSCLKVHAMKHLIKKEYECEKCHRAFASIDELDNHKTVRHPADLVCPEPGCVGLFSEEDDLMKHVKDHHIKRQDMKSLLLESKMEEV